MKRSGWAEQRLLVWSAVGLLGFTKLAQVLVVVFDPKVPAQVCPGLLRIQVRGCCLQHIGDRSEISIGVWVRGVFSFNLRTTELQKCQLVLQCELHRTAARAMGRTW